LGCEFTKLGISIWTEAWRILTENNWELGRRSEHNWYNGLVGLFGLFGLLGLLQNFSFICFG
jgi:hypothetical protein